MWEPVDRHVPDGPLARGTLSALLWVLGVGGLLAIVGSPVVGGLFLAPFVLLAFVFAGQLAWSAYRGGRTPARSDHDPETSVEAQADAPLAVLRGRYAHGEIDHGEFERRVDRLLETEDPRPR
ncbi:MAG: SHOCT domain-containing protein [Salinigranum sp.]